MGCFVKEASVKAHVLLHELFKIISKASSLPSSKDLDTLELKNCEVCFQNSGCLLI